MSKDFLTKTPKNTPSKQLRSVIFRVWEKRGSKGDFEEFYKESMKKLTDKIKEELQ